MPSGVAINDVISQHFTIPSPGAVNDKVRAFYDKWYFGNGSPEGVVTAPTGSVYLQGDGTTTIIWTKQSGAGNTGWGTIAFTSIRAALATTDVFSSGVAGDATDRFVINADGKLEWGGGGVATDVFLERVAGTVGRFTGHFQVTQSFRASQGAAAEVAAGSFGPSSEAGLLFGSAGDTNIYRIAADTLQTDDTFSMKGVGAAGRRLLRFFSSAGAVRGFVDTTSTADDIKMVFTYSADGLAKITLDAATGIQLDNARTLIMNNGSAAGGSDVGAKFSAGTGAPNNANGANGDFYFRVDGAALSTLYQRRAGAWVGIV